MSSKRKWDQAGPEPDTPSKAQKVEDGKTANEAAVAAAAIAAKIAAQFSGPGATFKDPHDGAFVHDIDINDVRNRYLLTKGTTQSQVCLVYIFFLRIGSEYSNQVQEETGASVSTKGVWYPDRTKATEKDPPLYIHISASSQKQMEEAIAKVNELIAIDMGSLVEDKKDARRERVRGDILVFE